MHSNILLYINYGVELLNFQEEIGTIPGKNRKDIIIDRKVDQFYDLLWYFRASEVKVWHLMSIELHNWSEIILTHIS